jgi:hypothetical protein
MRRVQVRSLAGQLGGKQSPGQNPCDPSISNSCSPTEEAIALEAMRWRYLLRRRFANESSQEYQKYPGVV